VPQPAQDGNYTVIGIFTRNGKKQMDGVLVGDKLVKVGDLATKTATFGAVIAMPSRVRGRMPKPFPQGLKLNDRQALVGGAKAPTS
jgi:hypothetical protein